MALKFCKGDVVRIVEGCDDIWIGSSAAEEAAWGLAHDVPSTRHRDDRGRILRIFPAIILNDVPSTHPGQEGRLAIEWIWPDGSRRTSSVCWPDCLVHATDEEAICAQRNYRRRLSDEARQQEEVEAIAREHGIDPVVAERYYRARLEHEDGL